MGRFGLWDEINIQIKKLISENDYSVGIRYPAPYDFKLDSLEREHPYFGYRRLEVTVTKGTVEDMAIAIAAFHIHGYNNYDRRDILDVFDKCNKLSFVLIEDIPTFSQIVQGMDIKNVCMAICYGDYGMFDFEDQVLRPMEEMDMLAESLDFSWRICLVRKFNPPKVYLFMAKEEA